MRNRRPINTPRTPHHAPDPAPPAPPALDPQLTPEECQRLADATKAEATPGKPWEILSVTDAEQIQEDVHGQPLHYGTPSEAIAAMERRIAEMRAEKSQLLTTLDDCPATARPALERDLAELNQRLAATASRLEAYRFQHRHEN